MIRLPAPGAALVLVLTVVACGGDGNGTPRAGARGPTSDSSRVDSAGMGFAITDGELRNFARASARLEDLRREVLTGLQEAANAEERQRVRRRFREARDSLLRQTRLGGTERYEEIREAVENDERLRERWEELRDRLPDDPAPR